MLRYGHREVPRIRKLDLGIERRFPAFPPSRLPAFPPSRFPLRAFFYSRVERKRLDDLFDLLLNELELLTCAL
jgi:hypothetical protein